LLIFLILARILPKEDFGVMAVAMLVVEFFKQAMPDSIAFHFLNKSYPDDDYYNSGFFSILFVSLISFVFIFCLSGPLAHLLGDDNINNVLQAIAILVLFTGMFRMHEVWLTKNMYFKELAIRSFFSVIVGGIIGIFFALAGYGIISLIIQQISVAVINIVWLWSFTPWKPKLLPVQTLHIKNIWEQTKFISLNNIMNFFSNQFDVFICSFYLGAVQTGIYSTAKRLYIAFHFILNSSSINIAQPILANHFHTTDDFKITLKNSILFYSYITLPIFSLIAIFSEEIVYIVLGAKWNSVAPLLFFFCIVGFLRGVSGLLT
jgi:O-antigen/teichoic acid export membrane protein